MARNNRSLYIQQLSNIFRVYHKQYGNHMVFGSVGGNMLVQSFRQTIFVWAAHVKRASIVSGTGIVNASLSGAICQGPVGRIWVPVPMDHWSRIREVGLFHFGMDPIPRNGWQYCSWGLFHSWLSSHNSAPSASLIVRHLVMRGTCTLFWAARVTTDKSPGPPTSHCVVVVVDRAIDLWIYLMLCLSVVLSSENRSVCVKSIVKPSMELFL